MNRIPRGPTRATRDNPFGLTARQLEVLRHLSDGMTNAEIADRLLSRTGRSIITSRLSSASWAPTVVPTLPRWRINAGLLDR